MLNMIICELPPDHPVSDTRPLRDTLGHTPLQARPTPTCIHSYFQDTSPQKKAWGTPSGRRAPPPPAFTAIFWTLH